MVTHVSLGWLGAGPDEAHQFPLGSRSWRCRPCGHHTYYFDIKLAPCAVKYVALQQLVWQAGCSRRKHRCHPEPTSGTWLILFERLTLDCRHTRRPLRLSSKCRATQVWKSKRRSTQHPRPVRVAAIAIVTSSSDQKTRTHSHTDTRKESASSFF